MPLNKTALQSNIKTSIIKLKPTLISKLDGGPLSSQLTGSNSLYVAMGNIKVKCASLTGEGKFDENTIKKISSNEWANAIGSQVIDLLAEELSKIIAEEIDKYVKQITVIIPSGQAVYAADASGGGYGITTVDSGPGKIT